MKKKLLALLLAFSMIAESAGAASLPVYAKEASGIEEVSEESGALDDGIDADLAGADIAEYVSEPSSADNTDNEGNTETTPLGSENEDPIVPDDATEGDYEFSEDTNTGNITIKKYVGTGGTVTIPATLDGKPVTEVYISAFSGTGITSLTVPANVTKIGSKAFKDCKSLTSVTFDPGESALVIDGYAFQGCTALSSVSLSGRISSLSDYMFKDCSSLGSIVIPSGVTKIGEYAFTSCKNLTSVNLPNGLTEIGYYAFNDTAVKDFEIPASLTTVGKYALSSAETASFANGTVAIPDNTLYYAMHLTAVDIPSTVKSIGAYAFYGCSDLPYIDLPDAVSSIGYNAFYNCNGLTSISIPAGATVDEYAFQTCSNLKSVTLGDNSTIGKYAFKSCSSINNISIGENVTVDPDAFNGIALIGSIPDSGISYALMYSDGTLIVSGKGPIPDFTDAVPAPWVSSNDKITSIKINEGVTSIGENAFKGLTNVSSIILPNSVTKIGKNAFDGCTGLEYVEFSKGVRTIEDDAFAGCVNLRELVFFGDAPSISNKAFPSLSELKGKISAYYPQTATGWSRSGYQILPQLIEWETWDDTLATKDIVMVLDCSGSMSSKMNQLKEAAAAFINGVGGRRQNTNIAIVRYDSNAKTLANFSSDCTDLVDKVNTLTSGGGTNYINALKQAEGIITNSRADKRTIVMFSDGQPGDNKDTIYNKADELRDAGYTIFTVGLMSGTSSSQDSYRDILIRVAGSEKRYFEAEDINYLLQAFLNLSKDMGRGEKTTAEVSRHNIRHDLMEDYITLTKGSAEVIDLTILPALGLGEFDYVALVRNGEEVLSDPYGRFSFAPGLLFNPGDIIYAVTYDSRGRVIEKKRIGIMIIEEYTITYFMNDEDNSIYTESKVIGGEDIIPPTDPERDGYRFLGWYTTKDGAGFDFFSLYNSFNRLKIESDMQLYAHWSEENTNLNIKKDVWDFTNSSTYYDSKDYEISNGDYARLLDNISDDTTKQKVKDYKNKDWGGSCFGMSSTTVLNRQGQINITEFDPSSLYLRQASMLLNEKGDEDVGNIESMINFYHLRQKVGSVSRARNNYSSTDESANIKFIVDKLRNSSGPCVLTIKLHDGSTDVGGHAVVAYNFVDEADGSSTFKVYDCSKGPDKVYPIKVTVSSGKYTADLGAWPSEWKHSIFLKTALNEDDLLGEVMLTSPSFSFQPLRAEGGLTAFIETGYGDFEISDGTNSAVFKNGVKISGDLDAYGYGLVSEVGEDPEYETEIALEADKTYTITQASGATSYDTQIICYDEKNGFYIDSVSGSAGSISFNDKGKATTSYSGAADQTLAVSLNGMSTSWYNVAVSAASAGLTLEPSKDQVKIASATAVNNAKVTVSSDFNEYTFENVSLSQEASVIKESGGKTVIGSLSADFGCSVVFDSRLGSSVDTITGVAKGSKIAEPMPPLRDGFIFTGWYKDSECTKKWSFDTDTVNADTVLYAGWNLDENYYLIVTFRVKDEEGNILYLQKGSKLTKESCPKGADGKDLTWYADEACTELYDFNSALEKNTEIYSPDWNNGRKTEGDVPANEIPEGGIPEGIWVGGITNPDYTGSAVKPSFHVYDNSRVLAENVDYSVTYKNNVNAYTVEDMNKPTEQDKKKAPQVLITMKGNYTGKQTVYFSILKQNINKSGFTVNELSAPYTGSVNKPSEKDVCLYKNGKLLKLGTDYTVTFDPEQDYKGEEGANKTYTVYVNGQNNYSGVREVKYTIFGKKNGTLDQILLSNKDIKVTSIPEQTYIGRAFTVADLKDKKGNPITLVTYKGKALVAGTDFNASFENAKNPGTATIVLKGLGGISEDSDYAFVGTRKLTFKIKGLPISKAAVDGIEKGGYAYTGAAIKPSVRLIGVPDTDYTVKFENNVNAGTASVIFTGLNGYSGTKKVTFKINKVNLNKNNTKINNGVVISVPFEKNGAKPNINVTYGGITLKAGRDYKVTYSNNKKVATATSRKKPMIKVTGMGNYTGGTSAAFTIRRATMSSDVEVTAQDVVYSSKPGKYIPKLTVKDKSGAALKVKKDYNKRLYYHVVPEIGSSNTTQTLGSKDAPEAGTIIRVTVNGTGGYSGTAYAYYRIIEAEKDISKAKITIKNQEYTGTPVEITSADQFSSLTDAYGNPLKLKTDTEAGDIEVVSITGNSKTGTATVVFKGTGDGKTGYAGTKTVSFRIGTRSIDGIWKGLFEKLQKK